MTPERASESTAAPKLAPGGTVTRTVFSFDDVQAVTDPSATSASARTTRGLTWKRERMLEQHGSGNGIDVSLAAECRAAHLTYGAQRGGGRIPLVDETHRQARAFLQFRRHVSGFYGPRRVVAVLIQRQSHHEPFYREVRAAPNHLRNGRTLAAAPHDEPGRRRDDPQGVADGEAHSAVTVVDRQEALGERCVGNRESGIGESTRPGRLSRPVPSGRRTPCCSSSARAA